MSTTSTRPAIDRATCAALDENDPLAPMRERFVLPDDVIYLDGNSLGALPRHTAAHLQQVIAEEWGTGLIRSWNDAGWFAKPRTIGDRIALTLDLQAPYHACWIDRQQFENALLNLAVNARDAMNGHGSLKIQTLDDGEGKALAVRVIDTGCGMSPEVLERVATRPGAVETRNLRGVPSCA